MAHGRPPVLNSPYCCPFHPSTGEVFSEGTEGIACWLLDTGYNEEPFFACHVYFLGVKHPYKALKTTLKAEIYSDAWGLSIATFRACSPNPARGGLQ